jgi:hypothetical protein
MDSVRIWAELSEAAWISRFWAFYQRLSEPLKEGFTALVESAGKEAEQASGEAPEPIDYDANPRAGTGTF